MINQLEVKSFFAERQEGILRSLRLYRFILGHKGLSSAQYITYLVSIKAFFEDIVKGKCPLNHVLAYVSQSQATNSLKLNYIAERHNIPSTFY